jgi:hypothetical protein
MRSAYHGLKMFWVSLVLSPLLAACPMPASGEGNELQFTPSNCGGGVVVACSFENAIAVGSTLSVQIMNLNTDTPRTDLQLISENPADLEVGGGPTTFSLTANNRPPDGTVKLSAVLGGEEIDYIVVELKEPKKLGFKATNKARGPEVDATGNEIWRVPVNELVFFQVVPKDGTSPGQQLMGKLEYDRVGSIPGEKGTSGSDGSLAVERTAADADEGTVTYTLSGAISFTAIVKNL